MSAKYLPHTRTSLVLFLSVLFNVICLVGLVLLASGTFALASGSFALNVEYPLLARRIQKEFISDILINFTPLRQRLRTYVTESGDPIGVYFEYLPTGMSIGVNEKEPAYLASLLKVPLVMGVYKLVEQGKFNLNDTLEVTREDLDSN